MNPKAIAIILFLMFTTAMLFVAGVSLWWVGLVVFGAYILWAIT
jgi:hypothetical protein